MSNFRIHEFCFGLRKKENVVVRVRWAGSETTVVVGRKETTDETVLYVGLVGTRGSTCSTTTTKSICWELGMDSRVSCGSAGTLKLSS